jgi:hypothetical protein
MGKRLTDENRLSVQRPDLVAQMVEPELASELSVGSEKKVTWCCVSDGHPYFEWTARVSSRVRLGTGCPACSGRVAISGWNDLATSNPALSSQLADASEATKVTPWSHKVLTWKCSDGHPSFEWDTSVAKRSVGHGCLVCSGQTVLQGWNDIATTHPHLVRHFLNPEVAIAVSAGSDRRVERVCDGTTDEPHPRFIWRTPAKKLATRGCPICSGKAVLVGWNDLGTRRPDLAAQLAKRSDGQTVTEHSNKKLRWFCEDGHPRIEWHASPASRSSRWGCSACATYGFDISKSGICYLVSGMVEDRLAIKFGISNTKGVKRRLAEHRRTGFDTIHALANFDSGQDCKDFESSLKNLMLALDIPTCASRGHNFDGKTESFFVEDSTPAFFARLGAEFTALGVRPVWVAPQAHAA